MKGYADLTSAEVFAYARERRAKPRKPAAEPLRFRAEGKTPERKARRAIFAASRSMTTAPSHLTT